MPERTSQLSPPSFLTVVRAQLNLAVAYMFVRRSVVAALVTVTLVGLFSFADGMPAIRISDPDGATDASQREVSVMFVGEAFESLSRGVVGLCTVFFMAALYGFVSPFRVWRDTSLRQRGYHWTLPVARRRHDLIRVAAGGVPLLVMLVILAGMALVGMVLGGHAATLHLVPLSFWAALGLTPMLLYLLSTIAVLRSDRPARPILIALGSFYLLYMMTLFAGGDVLTHFGEQLVVGPYSLTVAVVGPVMHLIEQGLVDDPGARLARIGLPVDAWPAAFTLWLSIALAGVIAAASIRPRRN